jgi:hypothetical protein
MRHDRRLWPFVALDSRVIVALNETRDPPKKNNLAARMCIRLNERGVVIEHRQKYPKNKNFRLMNKIKIKRRQWQRWIDSFVQYLFHPCVCVTGAGGHCEWR